nr:hypothetical protein [Tanacetum cinerariifolium]
MKDLKKLQASSNESASSIKRLLGEKWRIEEEIKEKINEHCSIIIEDDLPPKERDIGSFTLPCAINNINFNKALADLGASVSVMPYSTFTNLGLRKLASTKLIIELADKIVKRPKGIAENVLVVVEDMDTYREEGMGDVIVRKPFCREVCVKQDDSMNLSPSVMVMIA